MRITLKSAVCGIMEIIIGLIAIIGLAAPMLSGLGGSENGFDLMSLNSPYYFARVQDDGIKIMIVAFGILCAYMAEGIIYMRVFKSEAGDFMIGVSTLSFVPLIIAVLAFIVYIVCKICLPEKVLWSAKTSVSDASERREIQTKTSDGIAKEERKLQLIGEYFRLYNEGAITMEEYEKEKCRILNSDKEE